jgi:hypothetical protein
MVRASVGETTTLFVLRKILFAILVLGMAGSGVELVLLKHTEDVWQWIPLVLLAAGLVTYAWHGVSGGVSAARPMRWLMIGFIIGILSIPGAGKRMLREFKEYRPYSNIEQFRREIGKYVDKKEVARLERYVTLN